MKPIIFIFCLGFIFAGCTKVKITPYQSQGVLIGFNMRMCPEPSCGGMIITINNDTAKNPPPYYLINETLKQMDINENTQFPINVSLDFKRDTGLFGSYNYIVVSKIKLDN